MTERSTQPIEIHTVDGASHHAWQTRRDSWSFGPLERWIVGFPTTPPSIGSSIPGVNNKDGASTIGPQRIAPPLNTTSVLDPRSFGKRGLMPISTWEGVVEKVKKHGFVGRLAPLMGGHRLIGRVEVTEFSFDDLSDEGDRRLVQPGAYFYWTIGRARNAAGTITNVSLVRFRRIPGPSQTRRRRSQHEADKLLAQLSG
jgi:hypothetical protein